MDHQLVCESIAQQLAQVWAVHRTPAFVAYLLETYGCVPRQPVQFAGIFSLQMIGGYLFPDVPAGPGPVIERLWLTDATGFHESNTRELLSAEKLQSDNPLVVYEPSRASYEPIDSHPWLHVYPQFRFCVGGDRLRYHEHFGFCVGCTKHAKLVVSDRVHIQDTRIQFKLWRGRQEGTA
jgi:hypothetical protein